MPSDRVFTASLGCLASQPLQVGFSRMWLGMGIASRRLGTPLLKSPRGPSNLSAPVRLRYVFDLFFWYLAISCFLAATIPEGCCVTGSKLQTRIDS
ncbi:hypothetical protein GYMLUDRAFT_579123 [Collybiopsis luxurians FD-317 M1]|uniref:Uncharacterized protein n=1 Tax=Collybiopsis luxurians FD-317 M1 TaxID=944289 RepID=A0A0D0CFD4_9AGAR|nr:hypothetical protein GYMLUDRAFT_579123 [Collybiopsis luxurians FD-317 M1]